MKKVVFTFAMVIILASCGSSSLIPSITDSTVIDSAQVDSSLTASDTTTA
jgi:uncharacterized protein YcfL